MINTRRTAREELSPKTLGASAAGVLGVPTWEDKDEAGGQASNDRDDLADVRDEERQQQGEQEPDEGLQHAPPPLPPHVLLHRHPLVAQPQAFDHRPAHKDSSSEAPAPVPGARPLSR